MSSKIKRARRPFGRRGIYPVKTPPQERLAWPTPPPPPTPPSPPHLWTYFPMALTSVLLPLTMALTSGRPLGWEEVLSYAVMGLVLGALYPGITLLAYHQQKRTFEKQRRARDRAYRHALQALEERAQHLARLQRNALEHRHPAVDEVLRIALHPREQRKRLWTRDPSSPDFLHMRIGYGPGPASFSFQTPPSFEHEDSHYALWVHDLQRRWSFLPHLPFVINLQNLGSLLVRGPTEILERVLYRGVLDLAVHHSPRLLQLGVITLHPERWEWMKWLPHTRALENSYPPLLAFDIEAGTRLLEHLSQHPNPSFPSGEASIQGPRRYIVLILDDGGLLRRSPSITQLVRAGKEIGVYLILVNEPAPLGVPAEVRLGKDGTLQYVARVEEGPSNKKEDFYAQKGTAEILTQEQARKVARHLLALEPPEPEEEDALLPQHVPLSALLQRVYSDILDSSSRKLSDERTILSVEPILDLWEHFARLYADPRPGSDSEKHPLRNFLHIPFGLTLERGELQVLSLNLLPEGPPWEGRGAYHTLLIGPTGSGKSEFLKTLIWSAAYLYPPDLLNIFFLDFKGGSALEDLRGRPLDESGEGPFLPHLVGIVTNPESGEGGLSSRAIARRGIRALQIEMERRESLIVRRGKAKDIWEYNNKVSAARRGETTDVDPGLPLLPHLLIILDEFSKALEEFPELQTLLDDLMRRGRAWGMYLLLANQQVTPAITKLLNNAGWRVALRMQGQSLHEFLEGRPGSDLHQVGRGYLLCVPNGHLARFQAAWGGAPLSSERGTAFAIYEIESSGRAFRPIYERSPSQSRWEPGDNEAEMTQGRFLTYSIQEAYRQRGTPSPRPIYQSPLPTEIALTDVLQAFGHPLAFSGTGWRSSSPPEGLLAPFGYVDHLRLVRHDLLIHAFHQDGHLWVLGDAHSGKDQVVEALLMALAHLYTPDQLWMYILDFGASSLDRLAILPHAGAYVPFSDRERYRRLLSILAEEYRQRKHRPQEHRPSLLVVLHHFHRRELHEIGDDQGLHLLETLLRHGKGLGIYLLLTSQHPTALRNEDATNLKRRLVLDMGEKALFHEAGVPRDALELTFRVPGRGYWMQEGGEPFEAQVARVHRLQEIAQRMDATWQGTRPTPIFSLPHCLELSSWYARIGRVPAGFSFGLDDKMKPVVIEVEQAPPFWLLLGPVACGKTNTLLLWAKEALHKEDSSWQVGYLAGKHPPFDLPQHPRFRSWIASESDPVEGWRRFVAWLDTSPSSPFLLLVDDGDSLLTHCPEDEARSLIQALRQRRLVAILALRNFSSTMAKLYMHPFREWLQEIQNQRQGLLFQPDPDRLSVYNLSPKHLSAEWREAFQRLIPGRALLVFQNHLALVQIPCVDRCP